MSLKRIAMQTLVGIILLSGLACAGGSGNVTSTPTPRPTHVIIEAKPKPNLSVNIQPFIDAGCVKENGHLNCSCIGLEEKYSLRTIVQPSEFLGGLSPKVPIVECTFEQENYSADEGIVHKGCLAFIFNKYIILENNSFRLINNGEEFKQFFAPVETPEEALSFAVALTNSYPSYNITIPEQWDVFVSKIEETYVQETPEGFHVHLFRHSFCGCEHPDFAVDYLVTRTGEVSVISTQKIFNNPVLDGMCID